MSISDEELAEDAIPGPHFRVIGACALRVLRAAGAYRRPAINEYWFSREAALE